MGDYDFTQENLCSILQKGSEYPTKGTALADFFGLTRKGGYQQVRKMIHDMRLEGYPIGSCHRGYYILTNEVELLDTVRHLNSRIKEIRNAVDSLLEIRFEEESDDVG